jgi:glucose-1-phosphate adenylyltransferase
MKSKIISVVMGGGRGKRLHPLTKMRCKPAVPLAGKYRLVDIPISNCLNAGLNQIYVLTQFNTASLHRHIQESYNFDPFGGGFVDILSAEQTEAGESWYQGTADAVRQNLHHYNANDGDLFLILSGDQLYNMDFRRIIDQHRETGADVTIAAKAMPITHIEGLGLMRVEDNLEIKEFVEKPDDANVIKELSISDKLMAGISNPHGDKYCLASMGIYVFGKQTLYDALHHINAADFGREVIPQLLGKVGLYSYIFDGYWEDIGSVRSFFEANLRLTEPLPPFNFFDQDRVIYTHPRYLPASKINGGSFENAIVADGCIISGASLKRTVIGVRSVIGEGSHLENVVMMGQDHFERSDERDNLSEMNIPKIGIGKNCHISNAIIDKNARIGDNVRLSPKDKPEHCENGDIMVRDGVLIVSKDAIVPQDTVF